MEVLRQRIGSVALVMDRPQNPHNGAAVMRSCDAFGLQAFHVVLSDGEFEISRKVTQGVDRWVDVIRHQNPSSIIHALRESDFQLIAAHPQGQLEPGDLRDIARPALLMGNESTGIGEELTAAAEQTVKIPMRGFVESLNVSVSAALLLAAATEGRPGDLSGEAQEFFYARGLYHSVQRADEILRAAGPE